MIKVIVISILLCLNAALSVAQQRVVERSFSVNGQESVELDLKFGESITVKAWDRNEVSFRAVIEINSGKLNDALVLDFSQNDKGLSVAAEFDRVRIREGRRADCPNKSYSTYSLNDDEESSVVCSNIIYELRVPADIHLNVESISSNIELIGLKGSVKAKSISGFVDLSWPENTGADLYFKTISGEVYSGIESLNLDNRKKAPLVGYELRGSIGSGGPPVSLESISGNIYLRKMN